MADYYESAEQPSTPGLGRIGQIWRRRKGIGFFAAALVAAGAVSLALSLPSLFRASATVLVHSPGVSEDFVRQSVSGGLETRIQTIEQQVMSRARLAQVIEQLNLYPTLRRFLPMEGVVDKMRGDVNVAFKNVPQPTGGNTTISFTINFVHTDPAVAAETANTLANLYVAENTSNRKQEAVQTADFLKDEVAQTKREMEQREARLRGFSASNAGSLPQQMEANIAALERLHDQLRQNVDMQMRALDKRELLLKPEVGATILGVPSVETPAARLTRLKLELNELQGRFNDNWPAVIAKKAEIESLEQQIAADGSRAAPPAPAKPAAAPPGSVPGARTVPQIDAEIKALRAREDVLKRQIEEYEARVESAPRLAGALNLYSRDYDLANERYQTVLKRYADAQLAATLEEERIGEQFRVIDPAVPPARALAPKRLVLIGAGLLAALALGVVVIVAAERFDSSVHTADELQSLTQLPLLATVSRIPTKADRRRRRRRRTAAFVAAAVAMALIAAGTHHYASGNDDLVRLTSRGT
jgi:polysaccharide chain length determinant protein (PEP-CTERM system associated)